MTTRAAAYSFALTVHAAPAVDQLDETVTEVRSDSNNCGTEGLGDAAAETDAECITILLSSVIWQPRRARLLGAGSDSEQT